MILWSSSSGSTAARQRSGESHRSFAGCTTQREETHHDVTTPVPNTVGVSALGIYYLD